MIALMTILVMTSVGASTIDEDPVHAVDLIESPPTFGRCQPPLATIGGLSTGFPSTSLTVSNHTSTKSHDALLLNLVVDGTKRLLWLPLDLQPGKSARISIEFLRAVDSNELVLCGERPGTIVDGPDPVATVSVEESIEY
jgi:hypothetical protein